MHDAPITLSRYLSAMAPIAFTSRHLCYRRLLAIALALLPSATIPLAARAAEPPVAQSEVSRLTLACAKRLPVLVIDNFPRDGDARLTDLSPGGEGTAVDLDGDEIADLFHGELVEILYQLEGRETRRLALPRSGSLPDLTDLMTRVLEDLESGRTHYALINLSQVTPLKISAFKVELFADDLTVPEVTAANLPEFSARILATLGSRHPEFRLLELRSIFSRFEALGVPIVVAAGNAGPAYVNLFSLMPGVISVGSLSPRKEPLLTSAMNPYVKHWRAGVVVPREVAGGVDLNSDALPDVPAQRLSGRPSVASAYHGKPIEQLVRSVPDEITQWDEEAATQTTFELSPNAAINILPAGIYRVDDLAKLHTTHKNTAALLKSLGEFVLKVRMGQPLQHFFDRDSQGRLVYNPAADGSGRQLTRIPGTSFAAPRICRL
jgi:hypothetical protein